MSMYHFKKMDLIVLAFIRAGFSMHYFAVSLAVNTTTRSRLLCTAARMGKNGNGCEYGNILLKILYNFF